MKTKISSIGASTKRQQHCALQHKAAADGNADGWDGALKRRQKAADDDIEADEQIRDAVVAERAHGVGDELVACM